MQEDLDKIVNWSKKWLLNFNKDECKVMHIGKKNIDFDYVMDNRPLLTTDEEKDLGVVITSNLKPSVQVARAAASANAMLGCIKCTFTCLN